MSRKETRNLTKLKREQQDCHVYTVKVDTSKLNSITTKQLQQLFLEGKWLYNSIIASGNVKTFNTKISSVSVKVKDTFETRKLSLISAGFKQSIKDRIFSNIKTLHTLKSKRNKVGRVGFKSQLNSIPLRQHNYNFTVNLKNKTVKLEKIKQALKVYGLDQIPQNAEIANAVLIKNDNDYYINITAYVPKEKKIIPNRSVGIDMGCISQLTLSNGIKLEYSIPVNKRIKRLDRKIMKKDRIRSNNKWKDQIKRRKEYLHLTNTKQDIKNKIIHVLTSNFKYVCFQDENIQGWKNSGHGKKIQSTSIGGIMSALKRKTHTPLEVDRFFASTQICPNCGNKQKLEQDQRVYDCSCGFEDDRDVKSATMIEREGLKQVPSEKVPMECRDLILISSESRKPQEIATSTINILNIFKNIKYVKASCDHRVRKPLSLSQR